MDIIAYLLCYFLEIKDKTRPFVPVLPPKINADIFQSNMESAGQYLISYRRSLQKARSV
jgi:hypothetical protein